MTPSRHGHVSVSPWSGHICGPNAGPGTIAAIEKAAQILRTQDIEIEEVALLWEKVSD